MVKVARMLYALGVLFSLVASTSCLNDRPVIGVLLQEATGFAKGNKTYVPASYVKFIEAGGAQVVPIFIDQPLSYYKQVLSSINGVLFPGGDVDVGTSGFARAGKTIFEYAKLRNLLGDYFPLWGTCNGFELLAYLFAGDRYILTACKSEDQEANLNFEPAATTSKLFGTAPQEIMADLATQNITANFHTWCLTRQNFTKFELGKHVEILSTSRAIDGAEFVSTFESKEFPFYGTQFHPEKSPYEWNTRTGHNLIPHTAEAIRAANYFSQFFVNEARRSRHVASNEVLSDLIYNFQPEATQNRSGFTQIYFFE